MTTTNRAPEQTGLPWDRDRDGAVCPACPGHGIREGRRHEIVLDGARRDGSDDHREVVRVIRRAPGLASGPFEMPRSLGGPRALALIDYLERQTFEPWEARRIVERLLDRYPTATVHVWPIRSDPSDRIAEDAYWDGDEAGVLVRAPVVDIEPHLYPMDVGWRLEPEDVEDRHGRRLELWRGCLYVDPMAPDLVRFGWAGLEGSGSEPR